MRFSKQIFLSFVNSNQASTNIQIAFQVKTIHVKAIGYDCDNTPAAGAASYMVITSDLVDNQAMGVVYNDSTYAYSTFQDIVCDLKTPRYINGNFTFFLTGVDGNPYTPVGGGTDRVCMVLEFNENTDEN